MLYGIIIKSVNSSFSIPVAMVVKTKAYRKANLLHPLQKCILIAEVFKHSAVFNNTGRREKVESATPARVPSREFIRAYTVYISTMQGTSYSFPFYDVLELI